ncbi:MAG TPA: [FeFe] hydrogenase H-cluster radical SAM maturase HydE [Candidatus Copromorpha excrementigallinarum]|uniref:[FeFe] hydrogenase H-cluster radical SAM maturase HydE n=1 Tax=Candidatus Allocopromorpha excrementigallinarum TaxID=2840742 RepID=A0A9D1I3P1_9FIRM|nr:[FeFe] hydrogenase H-cluster radical SAM maturase HydE [Candidatus Copromorpha excrementigallinarum]
MNGTDAIRKKFEKPEPDTWDLAELFLLRDFSAVYREADRVREERKGNIVRLRAIIEFSNICSQNCLYCGLRRDNEEINRYAMTGEEILRTAEEAVGAGYETIVLQSGEGSLSPEALGDIVASIKSMKTKKGVHPAVTLSCGQMKKEDYALLRKRGADRYLLKHETADRDLYRRLHPQGGGLKERLECLELLRDLGYETGSGFMTGLPGQTVRILAEDLLLLKKAGCSMAGIGPFIPNPKTPLGKEAAGDPETARRAVALGRLLLPEANLPVTTALSVAAGAEEGEAGKDGENPFSFGANVVMKKVTPDRYKRDYEIYPAELGKTRIKEDRRNLEILVKSFGREPL